ncbi:hypothetical protein GIB19_19130 [Pseudomonas sp. ITEM 17296]|nr:hypothetical protein [Pseudomonas sp. ITEM 17296]
MLLHHLDLVITQLESLIGIKLTDQVVDAMVLDFSGNRGYEYKAISLYNLPIGFAYMTEAKDLYGCKIVDGNVAAKINAKSTGFETNDWGVVRRKSGAKGTKLRLYFNNHRMGDTYPTKETVDLEVVELKDATTAPQKICSKTISFSGTLFFNTLMRWERLRQIAVKHL